MSSKPKLWVSIFVFGVVINLTAVVLHTTYVTYQRYEDARDIEILKFLPSGADKVDYVSEDYVDAAVYQMVDIVEGANEMFYHPEQVPLLDFLHWTTKDLKAVGMAFYGNNDLYVLKHKREVEEFQFTNADVFAEIDSHNGIKIYRFRYQAGAKRGTIYFTHDGKYVVHSSDMNLLKRSLDLIDGKGGETAYDEFEPLITGTPKKFWANLVLEHIKNPDAKIPYLAGGASHGVTTLEELRYIGIINSDPRNLHGGVAGGLTFYPIVYYVVLQCVDEDCIEKYTDMLYEQKCFDIEVKGNFIHAKKFDSDGYSESKMFPPANPYLGVFIFFGYEWRGSFIPKHYFIRSPEFPPKGDTESPALGKVFEG
jgi:hypothetical protein